MVEDVASPTLADSMFGCAAGESNGHRFILGYYVTHNSQFQESVRASRWFGEPASLSHGSLALTRPCSPVAGVHSLSDPLRLLLSRESPTRSRQRGRRSVGPIPPDHGSNMPTWSKAGSGPR